MPQPPTTYMGLIQPSEDGDDGLWDKILTTLFLLVDGHDHTTGKGHPLGSASLTINADLDFHNFRAIGVGGAAMRNQPVALTTGTNEFFVFGGNAYFRSGAGVNVQITNGGALNMTTVGGIAGDYTSIGAEVAYVDASDTYTFKQQVATGVRQYARMASADVRMYEYKAAGATPVPTNFVGLASPTALAASYTMTFPASLPTPNTTIMQVTPAGVILFSNTVPAVTADSLTTTTGGVTAGANQNITVSGTGQFKHGSKIRVCSPFSGFGNAFTYGPGYVMSTGIGSWVVPVLLDEGERITALSYGIYGDSSVDVTVSVYKYDMAGAQTLIGTATVPNQPATWTRFAIAGLTATTISTADQILVQFDANATNLRVGAIRATYDRP